MAINKKFIPLDKSWIIRMGFLDIVNGYKDIEKFLSKQKKLGDDLLALKEVSSAWNTKKYIDVGESGTIYRLFKFASWHLKLDKKFIIHRTLAKRKINNDSNIVNLSQKALLKIDNATSQWATAKALLGDEERIKNPPFKLALTYLAVKDWRKARKLKKSWEPRCDETILNQVEAFIKLMKSKSVVFKPEQAEDYCFAYTFGFISEEDGKKRWPSLQGHESNRIVEMTKVLKDAESGKPIASKDHRVVQAISMWAKVYKKKVKILYPESVNKSWPQFWDFLKSVR
jgi:hypothetical protein